MCSRVFSSRHHTYTVTYVFTGNDRTCLYINEADLRVNLKRALNKKSPESRRGVLISAPWVNY